MSKVKISTYKFNKMYRDLDKYVNIDTWECLDILDDKDEEKGIFINLKYKFSFMNKELDHKRLCKELWATYYGYFILLINYIRSDNSIDYGILWLNSSWLNKLKGIFKRNGLVKYTKLWWDKKNKYYVNPLISGYSRVVWTELYELFNEENKYINEYFLKI